MHRSLSLTLLAVAVAVAAEESPTIIVTAERGESDLARAPVSVDIVDDDTIAQRGGALSVVDWFRELPGVGVFSKYGGIDGGVPEIRLRGLESAYTQVVIDGIPLNDPTTITGDLNFAFLAPAGLSRIEVVKGSQSGLYGSRAIGGVAGLRTIRPTATHEAEVGLSGGSFGTIGGQAQATGPLGDGFGYAIAVEALRSDGFTALTPDPHGDPGDWEQDGVERLSWNARLEARLDDRTTTYLALLGSRIEQDYDDGYYGTAFPWPYLPEASADDPVAGNTVTTNRIGAGIEHRGERLRLAADLAWTGIERENSTIYGVNSWMGPDPITMDYRGREAYAAASARYAATEQVALTIGGDGRRQAASQTRSDLGGQWSEDEQSFGLYAQGAWSLRHLELGAVVRHDEASEFGGHRTGRLSAAVLPDAARTIKLRGSAATGFRLPSLYERFGSEGGSYPYTGNPDLSEETSVSYEAGIDWTPTPDVRCTASWFRTDFEDKIAYDFSSFPSTMHNLDGTSVSQGVEAGAEFGDLGGSGIDLAADYTGMRTEDPDGYDLAYAPQHRGGVRVTANQQAGNRLRLWQTVRVERLTQYYTGGGESGRVDGYTLASAAVGATLDERYEASLRIENLTDEDYVVTSSFGQTYATMPRALFATLKARF